MRLLVKINMMWMLMLEWSSIENNLRCRRYLHGATSYHSCSSCRNYLKCRLVIVEILDAAVDIIVVVVGDKTRWTDLIHCTFSWSIELWWDN